jgi:hypothetical protein
MATFPSTGSRLPDITTNDFLIYFTHFSFFLLSSFPGQQFPFSLLQPCEFRFWEEKDRQPGPLAKLVLRQIPIPKAPIPWQASKLVDGKLLHHPAVLPIAGLQRDECTTHLES